MKHTDTFYSFNLAPEEYHYQLDLEIKSLNYLNLNIHPLALNEYSSDACWFIIPNPMFVEIADKLKTHIDKDIIQKINKSKNQYLVISEIWEAGQFLPGSKCFDPPLLPELLEYIGINSEKVILIQSAPNLNFKDDTATSKSRILFSEFFLHMVKQRVKSNMTYPSSEIKPYRFSCAMNCPRLHRIMIFYKLFDNSRVLKSFNRSFDMQSLKDSLAMYCEDFDRRHAETVLQSVPFREDIQPGQCPNENQHDMSYFYNKSDIDIINETHFNTNVNFFTEKTWRPISQAKPFIFTGEHNSLHYLKDRYGIETFSSVIDESYDNEPDNAKRMHMVLEEINRLSNLSNDAYIRILEEMKAIAWRNFLRFRTLRPGIFELKHDEWVRTSL